jgi:hypothetical protein
MFYKIYWIKINHINTQAKHFILYANTEVLEFNFSKNKHFGLYFFIISLK